VFASHNPVDFADPTGRNKSGERSWIQTPPEDDSTKLKKAGDVRAAAGTGAAAAKDARRSCIPLYPRREREVFKPMKAHWSTSAPNISTSNQNVRTNELPTDRSAQLAVAYANIAIIRSQLRSSVQHAATQSLEARAGEIWGHVALHVPRMCAVDGLERPWFHPSQPAAPESVQKLAKRSRYQDTARRDRD